MPDHCRHCGSPLEVNLDYGKVRSDDLFESGTTDVWKYQALYPLSPQQHGLELNLGEKSGDSALHHAFAPIDAVSGDSVTSWNKEDR